MSDSIDETTVLTPDTGTIVDSDGTSRLVVTSQELAPSWKETFTGVEGSLRRRVTFYFTAGLVATLVRNACFDPRILGTYLSKNLGPVERDGVRWEYILAVRAWDIWLGTRIWQRVEGAAKRDGALYGAIIAAVSRSSLYFFEHAYFLLTTETVAVLFFIDVVSLASAFALLPVLLPHSVTSRRIASAWQRMSANPELVINIVIATLFSVVLGALSAFITERLGGQDFIKSQAYDLEVPAVYAADTMTTAQMMAHPTITVHALRALLRPQPMSWHVLHSLGIAVSTLPFVTILTRATASGAAFGAFSLVAPATTFMLWDVLPIRFAGALATGVFLGLRAALIAGVAAWVLEELRQAASVRIVGAAHTDTVVLDDNEDVVAITETDAVVLEEDPALGEDEPSATPRKRRSRRSKATEDDEE